MIALSYKSLVDETDSGQHEWYYYPNSGSGQALLDSICKVYGKDLPIILYGFSSRRNLLVDLLIGVQTELSRGALIRRNFGIIPKTAEK